ncbi:hypothetical protein MRB53_002325 [Persea americana]|uniref:Uncharacterized protein n=1 Tax=Persea americana TaxID=3435 RepID=A0ACC2MU17_PERAE|nr:hypothetical protein MRB53_002325 [Persea americana]
MVRELFRNGKGFLIPDCRPELKHRGLPSSPPTTPDWRKTKQPSCRRRRGAIAGEEEQQVSAIGSVADLQTTKPEEEQRLGFVCRTSRRRRRSRQP